MATDKQLKFIYLYSESFNLQHGMFWLLCLQIVQNVQTRTKSMYLIWQATVTLHCIEEILSLQFTTLENLISRKMRLGLFEKSK